MREVRQHAQSVVQDEAFSFKSGEKQGCLVLVRSDVIPAVSCVFPIPHRMMAVKVAHHHSIVQKSVLSQKFASFMARWGLDFHKLD